MTDRLIDYWWQAPNREERLLHSTLNKFVDWIVIGWVETICELGFDEQATPRVTVFFSLFYFCLFGGFAALVVEPTTT